MIPYREIFATLCEDCDIGSRTTSYLLQRLESEGLSFLTKVLPAFSKFVIRSIEVGHFDRAQWTNFTYKRYAALPSPFRGLLTKLFDKKNGILLPEPDAQALLCIRQVCEYFYKLTLDFTPEALEESATKYEELDDSVGLTMDHNWIDTLRKRFETHYNPSHDFTRIISENRPRRTPGTVSTAGQGLPADSLYYIAKYSPAAYLRIPKKVVPHIGVSKPFPRLRMRHFAPLGVVGMDEAGVSEVLFVPKDSRGPRVIMREPYWTLPYQMSYFDHMVGKLEEVTKGRIQFTDQSQNRRLAAIGSVDGRWSTFDLKNASDSVSFEAVESIFRNTAYRHFLDFRSREAVVPHMSIDYVTDYGLMTGLSSDCPGEGRPTHIVPTGYHREVRKRKLARPVRKLAGMGSGLTFPTMSLLIHLTVSEAIARALNPKAPNSAFQRAMLLVYTFGDDLIVPSEYRDLVEPALQKVGLHLNPDKCFTSGPFRESCGGDYLNGIEVTPVRLKMSSSGLKVDSHRELLIPENWDNAVIELSAHTKELCSSGLLRTSEYLTLIMELDWGLGDLPICGIDSPVVGNPTLGYVPPPSVDKFYVVEGSTDARRYAKEVSPKLRRATWCTTDVYHHIAQALSPVSDDGVPILLRPPGVAIPRKVKLKKKDKHSVDYLTVVGLSQPELLRTHRGLEVETLEGSRFSLRPSKRRFELIYNMPCKVI